MSPKFSGRTDPGHRIACQAARLIHWGAGARAALETSLGDVLRNVTPPPEL
jgi:hypothetical protein